MQLKKQAEISMMRCARGILVLLLGFSFSAQAEEAADSGKKANTDFTKIANDGSVLPEKAALGSGATDWACTRENNTGLVWEVKTPTGLRGMNHTFTWLDSDSKTNSNGRAIGAPSGGTCAASGRCDTEKYVADVNAAGLCGAKDWRMPTSKELERITSLRLNTPAVEATFFPNLTSNFYWSGTPGSYYSFSAWSVNVLDAKAYYFHRTGSLGVRLVRGAR